MHVLRSAEARPLRGKRVLVVEDDFITLSDLELILRDAGAEIADLCRTVDDALTRVACEQDRVEACATRTVLRAVINAPCESERTNAVK